MATNLHEFRTGISQDVKAIQSERQKLVRAIALRALRDLVLSTRVDTGRARANWQVGETTPPTSYEDITFGEGASAEAAAAAQAINAGSTTILAASGDKVIWLHNGVPYITYLEDGPHVQDKMLEGTFQALQAYVRSL